MLLRQKRATLHSSRCKRANQAIAHLRIALGAHGTSGAPAACRVVLVGGSASEIRYINLKRNHAYFIFCFRLLTGQQLMHTAIDIKGSLTSLT